MGVATKAPVEATPHVRQGVLGAAPFAFVLLLAVFLLTLNINTDWHTSHEDNGLVFENAAINHIRFGLGYTKGQDFFDTTVTPPVYAPESIHPVGVSSGQEFAFFLTGPTHPMLYGHHPPLLALTVALSLLTFGYHFWAVRLVPIIFTLLALLLFYGLFCVLFNRRVATFASLLFISFPIAAYYGRDVAHEAPTLACEIGMALCYALWRRSGRNGWLLGVAGCVAVGMAYGWPMLFFAWLLAGLDALAARRLRWRVALTTAGVATLVFGLVVAQIAWAGDGSLDTLRLVFSQRAVGASLGAGSFSVSTWFQTVFTHNMYDFGPWTWLGLPAAGAYLWYRYRAEGLSLRLQVIALFGLGGLAHILIFHQGAYVHDYWQFYLIPFYAATLGWGSVALAQRLAVSFWDEHTRHAARRQRIFVASSLVAFAALALALSAPITYQLYAGYTAVPSIHVLAF